MVTASRSSNPISSIWRWGQRRHAIGRYLKVLPRRLREDYGHRGPYTPTQIEACIVRHRISSLRYVDFALALFCDPAHLRQLQREDGGTDFEAVRQQLGSDYFGGR